MESVKKYILNHIKRLLVIIAICNLLFSIFPTQAYAEISINYPGWAWVGAEDKNLPGIPSDSPDDYVQELISWGRLYGYEFTPEMASQFIYWSTPISSINNEDSTYLNSGAPVWKVMRDIIFLETMQNSLHHWEQNYIDPLGQEGGASNMQYTYDRAKRIYEEYQDYCKDLPDNYNPILTVMLGAGNKQYLNPIVNDGVLENFIDGELVRAVGDILSGEGYDFTVNNITIANIGVSILTESLEKCGNETGRELAPYLSMVSTATFGLIEGGLSLVIAPGAIFYDTCNNLIDGTSDAAKGAHLMGYYYFLKHYPSYVTNKSILEKQSTDDTYRMTITALVNSGIASELNNDPVGESIFYNLIGSGYSSLHLNNPYNSPKDIELAYLIGSLFNTVEGMRLEKHRKNLIDYVYYRYLDIQDYNNPPPDDPNLDLSYERINPPSNTIKISIKDDLITDTSMGSITSIDWIWEANGRSVNVEDVYPEAVDVWNTTLNDQTTEMILNLSELGQDYKSNGTLMVRIQYQTGSHESKINLEYYPLHDNIELSASRSSVSYGESLTFTFTVDGDRYRYIYLYQNQLATNKKTNVYISSLHIENGQYVFTFTPPEDDYLPSVFGRYEYLLCVDGVYSNSVTISVIDPEDTDGDGLPDEWEETYFESCNNCNPYSDADHDGKNNFTEWKLNTHPLETGIDEILNTNVYQPYTDLFGKYISTYELSGEIYSHIRLEGGTLDLKGRKVVVHGNVDVSGGTINVNSGELTIEGKLTINGGSLDLNDGTMKVSGDFVQGSGTLDVNGGTAQVNGNYFVQREHIAPDGTVTYSDSYGVIKMVNSQDKIIVIGDFVYEGQTGTFAEGVLEVKGDFIQKISFYSNIMGNFYFYNNFSPTGNHKVILSGDQVQKVDFESLQSHFNILEITNSSTDGVIFETRVAIQKVLVPTSTPISESKNILLTGSAIIDGIWHYDLGLFGNWALQKDEEIEGSFYAVNGYSNNFDLNSHRLIVHGDTYINNGTNFQLNVNNGNLFINGDLIHTSGQLDVNCGQVTVNGDYRIQSKNTAADGTVTYGNGSGILLMDNADDVVIVGGNFIAQSTYSHTLTAGLLEVKGNLEAKNINNKSNFPASGNHTLLLSGTGPQTVKFESLGARINILEITNSSSKGVTFETRSVVQKELNPTNANITGGKNIVLTGSAIIDGYWPYDLGCGNWTLQKDEEIEGDLYTQFDSPITYPNLNLNGYSLSVGKDLNLQISSPIDVNNGNLMVEGNLIQSAGEILVNGGTVTINGDFRIQTKNIASDGTITFSDSSGKLKMNNPVDYVVVLGDFIHEGINKDTLTEGVLEVKGDFIHKTCFSNYDYFYPTGNHKVILSGNDIQNVNFENVSSQFNILEITNSSAEGIVFQNSAAVHKKLITTNTPVTNSKNILLTGSATIDGTWVYDLGVYGTWTMQEDEEIEGDLYLNSISDLNGNHLKVGGDLYLQSTIDVHNGSLFIEGEIIQPRGQLNVNGGIVTISRDYRIQTKNSAPDGTVSYSESSGVLKMNSPADRVIVAGSFIHEGTNKETLTDGVLEIKGDFINKSYFNNNDYFYPKGNHKVVLSGDRIQNVNFESISSRFNILEITNSSAEGVVFQTRAGVLKELKSTSTPITNSKNILLAGNAVIDGIWEYDLGIYGSWILQKDEEIEGDLYNYYAYPYHDLNGHNLRVGRDVYLLGSGQFKVNNGSLLVGGSIIHSSGILTVGGGAVTVNEDYRIQTKNTDADGTVTYANSTGKLTMDNPDDMVLVGGDFVAQSSTYTPALTAGIIEVRGNLEAKYVNSQTNFAASGTHKLLLSGSEPQVVKLESIGARINSLEITNSSAEGVTFATKAVVQKELKTTRTPVTDSKNILLTASAALDGPWQYDLGVYGSWTLQKDEEIEGDLYLTYSWVAPSLNLNEKNIMVKGKVYLSSGILNLNQGTLILPSGQLAQTGGALQMNGGLIVTGNEKDITAFSIANQEGETKIDPVDHTVTVTMPCGTDLTGLVADFTLSWGAKAYIDELEQEKGITANDFSHPITYTVQAYNLSTCLWTVTVDKILPPQPVGLNISGITTTSITLNWDAIAEVGHYNIYRSTTENGPYTPIGTSAQNSFADSNLIPETSYWYKVSAIKSGDEGPQSEPQASTTLSLAVIQLRLNSYEVSEDEESIFVEVTRSSNLTNTVTVQYSTEDDTGVEGQDYQETTGILTFKPGETSQIIIIPLINDSMYEPNENFYLNLLNPGIEARIGDLAKTSIIILENDTQNILGFELNSAQINENAGILEINVVRAGNPNHVVGIEYYTEDLTAKVDLDYSATSRGLTFEEGDTVMPIHLPILDNDTLEGDRTFKVILTNPYEAELGLYNEMLVTIHDDNSIEILSEDGEIGITLWQMDPPGKWVRTNEKSYSGSYSWSPVLENNANYSFVSPPFSLKDSSEAVLKFADWCYLEGWRDWGIIEILTSEGSVHGQKMLNQFSDWIRESIDLSNYCGQENLQIRFRLFTDSSSLEQGWYIDDIQVLARDGLPKPTGLFASSVKWSGLVLNWDSIPNVDGYRIYRAATEEGPFTIIDNIEHTTYTDNGLSSDTSYWYKVSAVKNGQEGPLSDPLEVTTLTSALIQFDSVNYELNEEEESLSIEVTRSGNPGGTVTIDYSTQDGTATEGEDYIPASGTLTFEPDEMIRTITIPLLNDNLYEPNERLYVNLSNPGDEAELGENSQAVITIEENDYMESTGTVQYLDFEGGFFGIIGDDGLKYRPVNQPRKIKDGDRVRFGWIEAEGKVSNQMWGKTVRIINMEVIENVSIPQVREAPDQDQEPPDDRPIPDNQTEPVVPNPTIPRGRG